MSQKVVIVSACRTPFGSFGGKLKDFSTVELGARVVKEVISRASLNPADVEEVYIGVNMPSSNRSIARQITLEAGMPESVNSATMDRACCSSAVAIATAYRAILSGQASIVVAGGSENLSATPYFLNNTRWGARLGDVKLKDILVVSCPYTGMARAVQAGNEAVKHDISREMQDKWAYRSQQFYAKAHQAGCFKEEILPVEVPQRKQDPILMSEDEEPRPQTSFEKLAKLRTVYDSPTVTAGNAPGLSTGAAALVLMSEEEANKRNLTPLATIVSHAQVSGHPDSIAYIPAVAAKKALDRVNLTVDDIELLEINEAFAVMPLLSTKILAEEDEQKWVEIQEKTNVNGGAIAIGHPTGASAARILMTLIYELKRRGKKAKGLTSICGGIGEGESFIVEVG